MSIHVKMIKQPLPFVCCKQFAVEVVLNDDSEHQGSEDMSQHVTLRQPAPHRMSGPIQFSPAHPQPFSLEQAMQLEVNILVNGMSAPTLLPSALADVERRNLTVTQFDIAPAENPG